MGHSGFFGHDSNCSCQLPIGHRGTQGWHFRPTQTPSGADGAPQAYERCPGYWSKHPTLKVDPFNRSALVARSSEGRSKILGRG